MPQSGSSLAPGRIFHTLDALRGVAAAGVVVFHMQLLFIPIVVPGGYLAVDLFFMMSGVVLAHAYEDRFRHGMGVRGFMLARFTRLYPLYLLGTVFGVLMTFASFFGANSERWDLAHLTLAVVSAIAFLPDVFDRSQDQLYPLNIPCWSLLFEVLINFLYVAILPVLTTRRVAVVCALSAIVLMAMVSQHGSLDFGSTKSSFLPGLVRTAFGFSAGVLMARAVRDRPHRKGDLVFVSLVAVFIVTLAAAPIGKWRAIWDPTCVIAIFPVLVYIGTRVDPSSALRRLATFFGTISYALYVLHSPASALVNSLLRRQPLQGFRLEPPIVGVLVLAGLFAMCWLIDRFYDLPVRRSLGALFKARQSTSPV